MSIDLELYKVFVSIATCGSINKASQELFVTQSAVSQSLKNLEKELDCKLFERQRQGLVLTNKGKDLFENIYKPIKDLENAEIKLKQKLIGKKILTICGSEILIKHFVLNKLSKFINYDIRILNHLSTKDMIISVENNECDFTIIKNYQQPKKTDLICYNLSSLNYVIFYNPKLVTLENIYNYPIVIKEFGSKSRNQVEKDLEDEFNKFNNKIQVGHDSLIIDLVKNYSCVGFAPKEYLDNNFKIYKPSAMKIDIQILYKQNNSNALTFIS